MIRRYWVAAAFLGLTGCATSSPETILSDAKVDGLVESNDPATAAEAVEVLGVPEVPEAAIDPNQASIASRDKLVCRRETPTGSHLPVRICRWQSEIEERRQADQKLIGEMQEKARVRSASPPTTTPSIGGDSIRR
jgi:hypothetical protein